MNNPEETLKEVQCKLEACFIKNKTDAIFYPKEHVTREAMLHKLFIVDDTLLGKSETDFSHFDFMIATIPPEAFDGMDSYMDVLRMFWTQLSPYLKKLVINCEVANNGINAVEQDMQDLLMGNASMIHFLKLEGKFEEYQKFRDQESSGENIQEQSNQ